MIEEDDLDRSAEAPAGIFDGVDGRRVGVDGLGVGRDVGTEDLDVGVEGLAVGLVGVTDLGAAVVLVEAEETVDLVGVEDLEATEDLEGPVETLDLVGVEDLGAGVDLEGPAETLDLVGVEDLGAGVDLVVPVETLDLVGVPDLGVVVDLVEDTLGLEGNVDRAVGVEDLEGLEDVVAVNRPVGVAGLDPDGVTGLEPGPPDDEGLRIPVLEELNAGDGDGKLLLIVTSDWELASLDCSAVGRAFGASVSLRYVLVDSISNEGNKGVPGGVRSQS